MGQETELKLAMADSGWRAFARHPMLREALAKPHTQTLRNLYFDTPDFTLRRHRVALRLRRAGRRWLQTVKCASSASAGLSSRPEWEQPFSGRFDFSMIEDGALRRLLEGLRDSGSLSAIFDTRFERREWRFAAGDGEVLLMADRGAVEAGGRLDIISELELELSGAPIEALLDAAARLAQSLPLRAESRSKAQRGYDLVDDVRAVPVRAGRSPIDTARGAASALRAITYDCISQYQANEAGALQSDAPEFIHQMRVSLRRLRSALRVFGPVLPEGAAGDLSARLRALAGDLAEVRDRDVLEEELLAPVIKADPAPELLRMQVALKAERERIRRRAMIALQDGRQARLMIALLSTLHRLPADDDARALQQLARKRLARAHARMTDAARHASTGDIAALHALRIDVKRMRYAIEFFAPLLGTRKARRALGALADAQEQLGFLNDLSQAGPRLLAAAGDDPALIGAVARIAGFHKPRYRKVIGDAPRLLKRLARMPLPH